MIRTAFILIFILYGLNIFCQNIETDRIWIGSKRINNYEADSTFHSDTTDFLSSVLIFEDKQIFLLTFISDYNGYITTIDTLKTNYTLENNKFFGLINNDTLAGKIYKGKIYLKIGDKKASVVLTFLNPKNIFGNNKMNKQEIIDILISKKWNTKVNRNEISEEFLVDNKYKISTNDNTQRWDVYKISDFVFIVTNDFMFGPYIRLLTKISKDNIDFLIFKDENIEKYNMKLSK